jgi:hypothetical protein
MVLVIVSSTAAAVVLWLEYRRIKGDIENKEDAGGGVTTDEKNNRDFYLAMSIVVTVAAVVLFTVIIAMRKRISMAINIFTEASHALAARPILFISPFLTYIFVMSYVTTWIWGSLFIATLQEKQYDNTTGYHSYEYGSEPTEDEYKTILAYHIFALLWITQFIIASGNFVISGTVTSWYFTQTGVEPDAPSAGFLRSVYIYVRYHMGTVAFGALIIAIVQMCRIVLEAIKRQYGESAGSIGKFIMRCFSCCLYCLEKCLKYINKNAYIITNLHGYPFCSAAWTAYSDLFANALLVVAINGVGFLVITLFKIMLSSATVLLAYWLLSADIGSDTSGTDNQGSWFILTFAAFIGWMIASMFFELFSTIVDTVALCFMEDKKYNDGSSVKPYHASPGLQKFLGHASSATQEKGGKGGKGGDWKVTKKNQVTPM